MKRVCLTSFLQILFTQNFAQAGEEIDKKNWKYRVHDCTPTIEPDFCTSCLLDFDNIDPQDGNWFDGNRLFKIDTPECQGAMKTYIQNNPCDTVTASCYEKWNKKGNKVCRDRLDRLLYTVCELCCDCIPIGAGPGEYTLDVTRQNCPKHFRWDNCNLFPDQDDGVCNMFMNYRRLPEFAQAVADEFLEDTVMDYGCNSTKLWDVCQYMEHLQGNI